MDTIPTRSLSREGTRIVSLLHSVEKSRGYTEKLSDDIMGEVPKPLGGAAGSLEGCAVEDLHGGYPGEEKTLLEYGAKGPKVITKNPLTGVDGVNWWQTKYAWARNHYPKVYHHLRKLSLCRRYKRDLACTTCGKELKRVTMTCNSPLCPTCSKKNWEKRTQKAFEALEPFLGIYAVWSMWSFTLPEELREQAWDWEILRDLRRAANRICKEIVGGKVCLAVLQTFSSKDHSKKNPHFHIIVGGRKPEVSYYAVLEAWAGVLEKQFGYKCKRKPSDLYPPGIPVVIVQEGRKTKKSKGGPFLTGGETVAERKGLLYTKIRYEMRAAGQHFIKGKQECTEIDLQDGGVFKHYELLLGHQPYCYGGEVMRYFRGLPLESIPTIEKGVYLGALQLSRQQKRRLIRELRKKGQPTDDLKNRIIGELEYQILKGLPTILTKPAKKRYDLCSYCNEKLAFLGIWDEVNPYNSWANPMLLEYLIAHFGDAWARYSSALESARGWKNYGNAA